MEDFTNKAGKPSELQVNKDDMLKPAYGYHEFRANKTEHGFSVITFPTKVRATFNKE